MQNLIQIVSRFKTTGTPDQIKPLGNGLINDTYLVLNSTPGAPNYVLQRINHTIFTDVPALQQNIQAVTDHIRHKLTLQGTTDIDRRVLTPIPLKDDPTVTYTTDQNQNYWRLTLYIPDAQTFDKVDPHYSHMAGLAFGQFQAMLTDIPHTLTETIPDFHNMEFRLSQLRDAIAADPVHRLEQVQPLVDLILSRQEEMTAAERLHRQGLLPKRICHCDTKVNNMMFDHQGNVLCVIDLDTVMPSYIFSDYGDFLRTAASNIPEDSPETDKLTFRTDIFQAFTRGYLTSAAPFLTPLEIEMLPYAVALFPYMQATRFLTDYINDDTYYKTSYPTHNLVRTQNQLALLKAIDNQMPHLHQFIRQILPNQD